MEKYSITKKTIFYALNEVIIYGIILFIIVIYFWTQFYVEDTNTAYIISGLLVGFYLIIILIPVIILFNNYFRYNKNTILIFQKNTILLNGRIINTSEIQQIDVFANSMYFKGQTGKLPHQDNFYYIKLLLKDDSEYILTSLLGHNIHKNFKKRFPDLLYNENIKYYPKI